MSDLLFDINLQQLPDEYLTGAWRVADKVLNRTDPGSPLAQATSMLLQPNALQLEGGQHLPGNWSVQRDEMLNRPYLEIEVADEKTRALITRLRRSSDGLHSLLNLYFLSGMEMELARP